MDSLIYNRLKAFVIKSLGPDYGVEQNLSHLVVTIMTFIENKVNLEMEGSEKLAMALDWLNKLLSEVGVTLPPNTQQLIVNFIDRICEATKGMFSINPRGGPSANTTIAPATSTALVTSTSTATGSTGSTGSDTDSLKKATRGGFFFKR
jgi:hypothetical protein